MLVAYVYSPLALRFARLSLRDRRGRLATFVLAVGTPTLLTFLLSGLWHGAGWNFVLFGAVHGVALLIVQARRQAKRPPLPAPVGWGLTMLTLVLSFVLFRSADMAAAGVMFAGLFGQAVPLPAGLEPALAGAAAALAGLGVGLQFTPEGFFAIGAFANDAPRGLALLAISLALCLCFPNTTQILRLYAPVVQARVGWKGLTRLTEPLVWRVHPLGAAFTSCVLFFALLNLDNLQEFIYFQF